MSTIEQTITQIVRSSVNEAIRPLIVKIDALEKQLLAQGNPSNQPYIQQKELAMQLGCSVSKLKLFRKSHPDAPKPNPMGLYDLAQWRAYLKDTPL
ncbi:hypothetical protein [Hydromonas duriensis]|uniref:Uncharacterized protein n=1 Tax=Hydromonas duriensis TaxID=1527608 RepID=A0A4R6Y720_9BURK|nr:hypothetical protein [Hydromonas duriensis]TDR30656.1 hypothetical protein DFR44_1183 [Hydromonas duriensis]